MKIIPKIKLETQIRALLKAKKVRLPSPLYENKIQNWWFPDNEIKRANAEDKLLTLDLDVGNICHYNCCFCFARAHRKTERPELKAHRIKKVIDEAAGLGIKTIKIVGAGEPTLFPDLLEIVRYTYKKHSVRCIIFTTGDVFGNDAMASQIYQAEGIKSGLELARKFHKLKTAIIVKYMTLDRKKEGLFCGVPERVLESKDRGLLNLIKAGFNQEKPTRLGVDFLMLKEIKYANGQTLEGNHHEAVAAFKFFNHFNIFMVLNTSMDCGFTVLSGRNTRPKESRAIVLSPAEAQAVAEDLVCLCPGPADSLRYKNFSLFLVSGLLAAESRALCNRRHEYKNLPRATVNRTGNR